jgi:hypothetical protein
MDREVKEYYDSVICAWVNSPHKGSWVFTLQTKRGSESWDYMLWRKLVQLHIGLTLTLDASDVDSISNKIMPFVRNNIIERILK